MSESKKFILIPILLLMVYGFPLIGIEPKIALQSPSVDEVFDASSTVVVNNEEIGILSGHTNWVISVDFSSDGSILASGSHDNSIILWDIENKVQLRQLKEHTGVVLSVDVSSDDQLIASGSMDKTIKLWNLSSG